MKNCSTSAIWSIIRVASKSEVRLAVTESQLEFLEVCYKTSNSVSTRSNIVGILGTVGASTQIQSVPNVCIGSFLKDCLCDTSVTVVSECLNGIFEIYGNTTFSKEFSELEFLPLLKRVSVGMKDQVRTHAYND